MYKNLGLLFILISIFSCSEAVEEIEPDSFLNIAGAQSWPCKSATHRLGFSSHRPLYEYGSQAQFIKSSIIW